MTYYCKNCTASSWSPFEDDKCDHCYMIDHDKPCDVEDCQNCKKEAAKK